MSGRKKEYVRTQIQRKKNKNNNNDSGHEIFDC